MKFKKVIAVCAATVVFMSMTLNVSAAKSSTDRYISKLKKSKQVSLILDVDAYRAAYSDLEEAFGNNRDAYIKHYLTAGVYEGRTKGILFDPLTYAEGYDDIKEAFGDDILAIVNHYVTFGVKENRTTGTAVGYEDIAAAVEDGAVRIAGRGESGLAVSGSRASSGTSGSQAVQKPSESQAPSGTSGSQAVQKPSESQAPSEVSGSQAEQKPLESQTPSGAAGSQTEQKPSENQGEDKFSGISIGRMTYIYADGDTLIRVEYYDENSKLIFYSDVVDYDSETKSYTENIYSYDENNQCDVLVRTDIYVNGVLSSTTSGGQTEQKPSEGQTEQKPSEGQTEQKPSEGQTEQKPSEGQTEQKPSGNQTEDKFPGSSIERTTYIYADDNTLIRVEYYDEKSKLIFYSDVVDYDRETKSYTENIYSYDEENSCDVLVRTDIYVNGVLSSAK